MNVGLSILFSSDRLPFPIVLNKKKKISISKISKDRLLALEEFVKNKTSFKKRKASPGLDILTGGTYTRIHSIKGLSIKETFSPLQTGVWWRDLF